MTTNRTLSPLKLVGKSFLHVLSAPFYIQRCPLVSEPEVCQVIFVVVFKSEFSVTFWFKLLSCTARQSRQLHAICTNVNTLCYSTPRESDSRETKTQEMANTSENEICFSSVPGEHPEQVALKI